MDGVTQPNMIILPTVVDWSCKSGVVEMRWSGVEVKRGIDIEKKWKGRMDAWVD